MNTGAHLTPKRSSMGRHLGDEYRRIVGQIIIGREIQRRHGSTIGADRFESAYLTTAIALADERDATRR